MLCLDDVGHLFAVDAVDDVAVLEAFGQKDFVIVVAEGYVAQRQFVLAPVGKDAGVDEQCR